VGVGLCAGVRGRVWLRAACPGQFVVSGVSGPRNGRVRKLARGTSGGPAEALSGRKYPGASWL
jgi:hypothetical protein